MGSYTLWLTGAEWSDRSCYWFLQRRLYVCRENTHTHTDAHSYTHRLWLFRHMPDYMSCWSEDQVLSVTFQQMYSVHIFHASKFVLHVLVSYDKICPQ